MVSKEWCDRYSSHALMMVYDRHTSVMVLLYPIYGCFSVALFVYVYWWVVIVLVRVVWRYSITDLSIW